MNSVSRSPVGTRRVGSLAGYDGYIIDITERLQFGERLLRAKTGVRHACGRYGPRFQQPLTAILGCSSIISARQEGDPFQTS
jgi:hypothetical protein